jgi:hypothetical protein
LSHGEWNYTFPAWITVFVAVIDQRPIRAIPRGMRAARAGAALPAL